jgi:hypothetical protein
LWLKDTPDCSADEGRLLKWTMEDAENGDPVAQFIQGQTVKFAKVWFVFDGIILLLFIRKTYELLEKSAILVQSFSK